MTSDEKRRKIAENIRGAAETAELGRYVYLEGTLFGMGIYARSIESLRCGLDALASLIEPETCRFEWSDAERGLVCSNCGETVSSDEPGYAYRVTEETAQCFAHCPLCGAKVVGE